MLFGLGKTVVELQQAVYDEIIAHAKDAYPNECCGVLVGTYHKGKKAFGVHRAENTNKERAKDRYIIDPKELNIIDRTARVEGMDIVGFYHSHPDHPDKPSEFDREWGQPGYSYVIISVHNGKDISVRSWSFEEEKEPFREEKIKIT